MALDQKDPPEAYDIRLFSKTGKTIGIRVQPEKIFEEGRLKGIKCRFMVMDG